MNENSRHTDRQVILLLGTPRSGTTWLAKILDTHPGVLYRHEPMLRLGYGQNGAIDRFVGGGVPEARARTVADLSQAYHDCCRPPFFRKNFLGLPPSLQWLAWVGSRATGAGRLAYRRLFTPCASRDFDLLIKEIGEPKDLARWVEAIRPEVVVIVRHPCGVVASRVRGQRLGLMPKETRQLWCGNHVTACAALGLSEADALAFDEYEFVALTWLVQNLVYQEIVSGLARGLTVAYEDLCRDPIAVTRSTFEFLGLELGPRTRQFLDASTRDGRLLDLLHGKRTYFGIFKDSTRMAAGWRDALTDKQVNNIMSIVDLSPVFRGRFGKTGEWPAVGPVNGQALPCQVVG